MTAPTYDELLDQNADLIARIGQLDEKLELTARQAGNALRRYDALSTLLEQHAGQSLSHDEKMAVLTRLITSARTLATGQPPDFANIAYNLSYIGYEDGTFSPSDRPGLYHYKRLADGRYQFTDAVTGNVVSITAPRNPYCKEQTR